MYFGFFETGISVPAQSWIPVFLFDSVILEYLSTQAGKPTRHCWSFIVRVFFRLPYQDVEMSLFVSSSIASLQLREVPDSALDELLPNSPNCEVVKPKPSPPGLSKLDEPPTPASKSVLAVLRGWPNIVMEDPESLLARLDFHPVLAPPYEELLEPYFWAASVASIIECWVVWLGVACLPRTVGGGRPLPGALPGEGGHGGGVVGSAGIGGPRSSPKEGPVKSWVITTIK